MHAVNTHTVGYPGPNEAGQPQTYGSDDAGSTAESFCGSGCDGLHPDELKASDEDVRKELNAIADVSAGRLFVLVNKFDEKDRNGDGADAVRQKVPAMLNSDAAARLPRLS